MNYTFFFSIFFLRMSYYSENTILFVYLILVLKCEQVCGIICMRVCYVLIPLVHFCLSSYVRLTCIHYKALYLIIF